MKIIFMIFLLILSLYIASSLDFGISPEEISLSGKEGERICSNFSLIGDSLIFLGEVKWGGENSRNMGDYAFSGEHYRIVSEFPSIAYSGKHEICFSAEKSGDYYGALLYKIQGTSYGIGTWIHLTVEKNENLFNSVNFLTGRAIGEKVSSFVVLLSLVFTLLVLILAMIIFFSRS